jgi:hypothetical protein
MKLKILQFVVVPIFIILLYQLFNLSAEPSINLQNCQPSGVIDKIKRAYDPLSFSVEQIGYLKNPLILETADEAMITCESIYKNNPAKLKSCNAEIFEKINEIEKCHEFWIDQCNLNGGRCNS